MLRKVWRMLWKLRGNCQNMRLFKFLMLASIVVMGQVVLFTVGRRVVVTLSVNMALSSSFTSPESLNKLIEAADNSNSSHTAIGKGWGNKVLKTNNNFLGLQLEGPGCGWTHITELEDEDDRQRYDHNEKGIGEEAKRDLITRTLILGYPHVGVESLGRLLGGYPATLLMSEPQQATHQEGEDDMSRARRSSWLMSQVYSCDRPVLLHLHKMARQSWIPLVRYGSNNQDILTKLVHSPGQFIDSIVVSTTKLRLSDIIWWLKTEAPQVHIVHMVRNPRILFAEILARSELAGKPLEGRKMRKELAFICGSFREDLSTAFNLPSSRLTMVKYEDYLDQPINTTNSLLDKLQLPHHPDMQPLLAEVERQQLDQVMMWTGDPDTDLGAWIRTEQSLRRRELINPNVYLDQDLVGLSSSLNCSLTCSTLERESYQCSLVILILCWRLPTPPETFLQSYVKFCRG